MYAKVHTTTIQSTDPNVAAMLRDQAEELRQAGAPAATFGADPANLRDSEVKMWGAWIEGRVVGMVALVPIADGHGELVSMRTTSWARRQGVGGALLGRLLQEAEDMGLERVSLKVGADPQFEPARHLYERRGFVQTVPFGPTHAEASLIYMTLEL